MIVVPSILSDSLDIVQNQINIVNTQTKLRRVQIDVIDPDFADELTIQPIDILTLQLHELQIDIHLMTNEPINDVIECSQIPGIKTIIGQIERMPSQKDYIEHIVSLHLDAGLSLDLYTPIEEIDLASFSTVKIIQIMGNKAGKQGQSFAGEPIVQKINELVQIRKQSEYTFQIAVDIGMSPPNAKLVETLGVDIVTPGSYLWKSSNIATAIEEYF